MLANQATIVLFARLGSGPYCFCGYCSLQRAESVNGEVDSKQIQGWELLEFRLELLNWDILTEKIEFRNLVQGTPNQDLAS